MNNAKVFISYAREDLKKAQRIYLNLKQEGLSPWMDKPPSPYELNGLLPGEFWRDRLTKEIKSSKFLVALLSNNSIKKKGYVQREFKLALDIMNELPYGEEFFIPLLLDKCEVPDLKVGFVSLSALNWHDLQLGGITPVILTIKKRISYNDKSVANTFKRQPIVNKKARTIDFDKEVKLENQDSLNIKWRTFIGKQKWKNNPILYNGNIICGSAGLTWNSGDEFDGIYSLDKNTGDLNWFINSLSDANEVIQKDGYIFCGTDGGEIFCIDAQSGIVEWCKTFSGEFHTHFQTIEIGATLHLLIFDFFGNILLIDSKQGTLIDLVHVKENFRSSAIKLSKNQFIIITQAGSVCIIEVKNRKIEIYRRIILGAEVFSTPILNGLNLIVGLCNTGSKVPLISVNLKTGKKNWHAHSEVEMGNIRANLVEYDNKIWLGGTYSNRLFGFDKETGKCEFSLELGENRFPAWSAIASNDNGLIFLPRNDGFLYMVDITKNKIVRKVNLILDRTKSINYGSKLIEMASYQLERQWENLFYSTPLYHDNNIYLGTDEGYFYCVESNKKTINNKS